MKRATLFSLVLVPFLILGCGGSSDQKRANKVKEIEDRKAIALSLQEVAGIYDGEVRNEKTGLYPFKIELNAYVVDEPNGVNEDGEMKLRPSLRARYRRLDNPSDSSFERSLIGTYTPETRAVVFISVSSQNTGASASDPNYLTISGEYADGQIAGEISDKRGPIGSVQLKRRP